ncbi:MAG: TonB-dependent receptor [Nitrospira sp. SB0662_bin_26]|nr:TonB-dependent receptor [Nitrospira sp. SB0662_bin_26]
MNGSPRTLLMRFRESITKTILGALLFVTGMTAIPPHVRAADWVPSVAGNVPTAPADAVRPLTVIDREDIELSGMRNVYDLLNSSNGRGYFNNFGIFRPFVVGSGRVAVLINGRRISDSIVDLHTLPISGVERIEILGDSAAALRGGHAIGGAVNIVLKRDLEGLQVQASPTWTTQEGGDFGQGSILWGSTLGRGHLTIGADLFRREEIRDKDRSYSRASWTPGGVFADTSGVSVGGNTLLITTGTGEDRKTIGRSLGNCEGSAYTGVLTNPPGASSGMGCGFAYADIAWHLQPNANYERESLFFNFDHPLGKNVDMYLDFRAAWDDTAERYAPSVGTFSFTPSEALKQKLRQDPDIDTPPDKVFLAHRFVGHGNRDWRTVTDEYDVTLGFRGRFLDGINYNTYVRYYRHDTLTIGDTFVSETLAQQAIEEGRYDIENPFSTNPVHLAAIRDTGLRLTRDQVTDHKTARVSFDGQAFALGGGNVKWAAGAAFAHEERRNVYDYRDVGNRSYQASDVLGSAGNSFSGERQRWSAFTEASLPLRHDWDLVLAGRLDEHDDVGTAFSHQITSQYRLHQTLTLRGSWNRASRAPDLNTLHQLESISYPRICDRKTFTGNLRDCPRYQVERTFGGNPNLKPDDAESFSFGAVTRWGPFTLSADWFKIGLSDMPARLSAQSIIDLEAEGRLPSGVTVTRDGDFIDMIDSPLVNSGASDVAGFNVQGNMDWKTDWAHVVFAAYWSHITENEFRVAGEVQPGDFPRNRVHALIRANRGNVTANWSVIAVTGYSNVLETARYKAWMGHNLTIQWQDALGVKRMNLTGGILNISNRGPSMASQQEVDLTQDSARGRTFFLTAKISFDP